MLTSANRNMTSHGGRDSRSVVYFWLSQVDSFAMLTTDAMNKCTTHSSNCQCMSERNCHHSKQHKMLLNKI